MCNAAGRQSCSFALFRHSVPHSPCPGLPSTAPDMVTVAVCPVFLPCFGAGTAQVWVPGMEHHVRFQRWGLALCPPDPVHVSEYSGGPRCLPLPAITLNPWLAAATSSECPHLGVTHTTGTLACRNAHTYTTISLPCFECDQCAFAGLPFLAVPLSSGSTWR